MSEDAAITTSGADGDNLLKLLVRMANKGGSFPLTLFVNGVVVSGTLVSKHRYFESFVSGLTSGFDKENAGVVREAFGVDQPAPSFGDDDGAGPDPEYVHLLDARVYAPGQEGMPRNGMSWRGRISQVDAISYGSFQSG